MNTKILYLFTRTPLHVGAGSSVGAVDQPVQRERHTGYPIIPGSSIKGVLRDFFIGKNEKDADLNFHKSFGLAEKNKIGEKEIAGALSFTEAKVLLFPVRSARGTFAFATCPHLLSRLKRDAKIELKLPNEPDVGKCLSNKKVTIKKEGFEGVILEEYSFSNIGEFPSEWSSILKNLSSDSSLETAESRMVYLSDEDFSHFAMNACQVLQHNRINPETGIVDNGALFNEEVVPVDTLFYATSNYGSSDSEIVSPIFNKLGKSQLIQFGGKSTTGLGFCTVNVNLDEGAN